MRINQILPGFSTGDAISDYVRELQKIFRRWGHQSEIYCIYQHASRDGKALIHDYNEHRLTNKDDDITIFHFSIGSELTEYFKKVKGRKILIYHNITPPEYFRAISDEKAMVLHQGKKELKELVGVPDLALAVSDYNRQELIRAGFGNSGVLPLIVNLNYLSKMPSRKVLKKFSDYYQNFLFVGRVAPNKKIEDVIKIFYYYKKLIEPKSRLFLVGSASGIDRYLAYLRGLIIELDLPDVHLTGHVNTTELLAYYNLADIFVCMSEHEGFCIPLLESMHFKIPIIAYETAAIPETLGGSGILVKEKNFPAIAEMADLLLKDKDLRKQIIDKETERLKKFHSSKIEVLLKSYLDGLR